MAWKISCIVHFWLTFEFSPSVAGCWTGGKEEQKGGLENSSPWEGDIHYVDEDSDGEYDDEL